MCSGSPFDKLRRTSKFSSSKKGSGVVAPCTGVSPSDVGDIIESDFPINVKECGLPKLTRDPALVVDVGCSHSAKSPSEGASSAMFHDN